MQKITWPKYSAETLFGRTLAYLGIYAALTEEEVEYHGLTSPGVANKVLEDAHQPRLERGQSVSKRRHLKDAKDACGERYPFKPNQCHILLTALCP